MRAIDAIQLISTWIIGARCAGCGAPEGGSAMLCDECTVKLQRGRATEDAVFADAGVPARVVRLGKTGGWRGAGTFFASIVLDRVASGALSIPSIDLVTWVPADTARRAERGGHLPERFARALARGLEVPAHAMLTRSRGRAQRGLDRATRASNVVGAFAAVHPPPLSGCARVLLVDDVRTTGATFSAARAALAPHVASVATLAIVGVGLTSHGRRADGVQHVRREVDHQ